MDKNNLTGLPDEITNLTRLTYLNLSNNKFVVYPSVINKLHTLIKLEYYDNEPNPDIQLPNLEKLYISYHAGWDIASSEDYSNTKSVNLLPNLKKIKFEYDRNFNFERIPDFIFESYNLEYLDITLNGNKNIYIDSRVYDLLKLTYLNIDIFPYSKGMYDKCLPSDIGKLTNLKHLFIRGYGTCLPIQLMELKNLETLHISYNQFDSMTDEMEENLKDKIDDYDYHKERQENDKKS